MSRAALKVRFAGPLVTLQDAGRAGNLRYGVPPSGPMDRVAHKAANVALGNVAGATCIEVSLGGLVLECSEGAVSFAVAGPGFNVSCGQTSLSGWEVHHIEAGQTLTVRGGASGSWCYVAFSGAVRATPWLSSTATHFLSGLGGGSLRTGDTLHVDHAELVQDRAGAFAAPPRKSGPLGVVIGPQETQFAPGAVQTFLGGAYRITDAFDRMGARLDGPVLELKDALSIPSEPILRGSVQVSGIGVPTVLLADHQTTGGYPKIATLLGHETDRLAQMRSGDTVHFAALTPGEAVLAARMEVKAQRAYFDDTAAPRPSLNETLMQANLIDGVVLAERD